jgi:hypothetical protein
MGDPTGLVLYTGLLAAVAIGLTAWRLVAADGRIAGQVDGMLGFCLVGSSALFLASLLPGAQLP